MLHPLSFVIGAVVVLILGINGCAGDVLVYTQATNQIIEEFNSLAARFGPNLPTNGLRVLAVTANPIEACTPIDPAPKENTTLHGFVPKFVAVIQRGNCSFADKVRIAQNASFDAVIVFNKNSNELEIMSASDDSDIYIPSVFVGETAGQIINYDYIYTNGFALVLNDEFPFNINTHLIIPFCVVVGLCFIIMFGFMIARCVRERRRIMRYRLPTSSLKKLESRKFGKNEIYDTCAICLDDYEEGDRLRILPCRHAYHTKCIDVWLTKNRRVCPVCKRKVYTIGERRRGRRRPSADSSTDSMSSYDPDDTTPLINNNQDNNNHPNHGTFNGAPTEDAASQQNAAVDDDILNVQPQRQRFNPFDRQINLPPQLAEELSNVDGINDGSESTWDRFKRFFSFNRANTAIDGDDVPPLTGEGQADDVDIIIRPSRSINTNAGNNILNANLSGSFRDENTIVEVTGDDDPILDGRQRMPRRGRKHRSAPNIMTSDQPSTSYSAQASSSNNERLGVAAIPNIRFDDSSRPGNGANNNII